MQASYMMLLMLHISSRDGQMSLCGFKQEQHSDTWWFVKNIAKTEAETQQHLTPHGIKVQQVRVAIYVSVSLINALLKNPWFQMSVLTHVILKILIAWCHCGL